MDNQNKKIPVAQATQAIVGKEREVEPSTFANVRISKTQPIQNLMDADLRRYTGDLLQLDGIEKQVTPDRDTGEVRTASLYTVKVVQKKARAKLGTLLTIKVKNSAPIIDPDEFAENQLEDNAKKVVVRFDGLAHYAFIGGESLNANRIEVVPITVKEAKSR
ncbi:MULTISPECIES: hypothetical protein [Lactobacillus]|jgi:hypothetical protein|uniref:hypothetical protein n=1 Tax=Lactobacillus TaxID=1578 RepID=UPI0021A52C79|nr:MULTISPECIES: hypothetical protein [Lactobacillus]MCT3541308.1 hypothetical protein [Lactobacillus crispatus]MCT3595200.1 hypothetical protein [Lactobacillus amylovorus]MDB6240225.1 hypothetical protein [Lactobacillus amylovorus]